MRRRTAAGQIAALVVVVACLLGSSSARAATRHDVDASIDDAGRRVTLHDTITGLDAPASGRLTLWTYADRQRSAPPSFDEFTAERLFVGGVSYGGFERVVATIDGCPAVDLTRPSDERVDPVRGRFADLPVCADARAPLVVRVEAVLVLAERYGTLGRARAGTQLGDPWYPLVVERGAESPPRASHRVRWRAPEGRVVVGPCGARSECASDDATHQPWFVLDAARVARARVRGVDVTIVTERAPVARPSGEGGVGDPFDPDAARAIAETTHRAIAWLRRFGMAAGAAPGPRALAERLVVVEIEERQRLATVLPGVVAVSDRAFRLLPIAALQRFHELGLRRRVFGALLAPHERGVEREPDAAWAADADASLLVDATSTAEDDPRARPDELVGFAGFHPAVDQLLYAPQVAFRSEYFHEVEERDPDRDGAERALSQGPFGHLVLEKLRDRLGPAAFRRAARAHLFEGVPWRVAAARAHGAPLDDFFATWLGAHRQVAYRLGGVASEPAPGGFVHRVVVERLGDASVREPVVVEVEDEDGARVRATWDEAGARGQVSLSTRAPFAAARLDPDSRLVQADALADVHPRFDDETRHAWKPPIFNSFAANFALSQRRPDLTLDFALRRRYDVRQGFGLRLASTARGVGGSLRYVRGLGRLRDTNATVGSVSLGVSALRSDTGFAGTSTPVTEAGLVLGAGLDTRRQIYDPATGASVTSSLFAGVDREDGACDGASCVHAALTLSVRAQRLFWPAVSHVLAVTGGGAVTRCPALVQAMPALSGRQLLRGYEVDELVGCATSYVILEDRWSPLRGLYVNAADLAWGRRLEVVPFAAAGLLSSRDRATDLLRHAYFDVGLGLRAMFDYAGVQPGVLALDFGVPLSRATTCRSAAADGSCAARRAPVSAYLSFEQTF